MTRLKVKVAQLAAQGRSNVSVRLEPLAGESLPAFEAGAHVDVFLANGLTRQYSIASAPCARDHYELCVKREAASRGGSLFIHQSLGEGDQIEISHPRNLFALKPAQHYVLVAAGIGITPLLSMAADLLGNQQSFSLHYYTRTAADVAFRERLENHFGTARVHLNHSDEGRSPRHHLPEDLKTRRPDALLYMCGPSEFMDHLEGQAKGFGWAADCVHKEAFSAPEPALRGDNETFQVQLTSTGNLYWIPPGQSIAQVLTSAGVDVPLSCEQGICGACLTRVISGQPDHRDMVLTDAERGLNNQMALCCSRSRSDRLVLDM